MFNPDKEWRDTDGNFIQAHGGCVLEAPDGTFYWYGEHKGGPTLSGGVCGYRVDVVGVSCYSSKDLCAWRYEGLALAASGEAGHDLHPSMVVERPKVVHCGATGEYVMWMHIDTPDYATARVGIAVSRTPEGPFEFVGSMQPNGCDSRDMTVFVDDDARAYLFYSSEWNKTMHVSELTSDYRGLTGDFKRILIDSSVEAPCVFRRGETYYLMGSGCTGWAPNPAMAFRSPSPAGPWTGIGNPCRGVGSEITFHCQSAFTVKSVDRPGEFIMAFDRWLPEDLGNSRYVWLPVEFEGEGFTVTWRDEWSWSC